MRKSGKTALAAAGVLAFAGVALAASHDMHELRVTLPDGSVAHVEYKGDVAPKVSVTPTTQFVPIALLDPFDPASFIGLDRVSAQIEQRASALMRQVDALQPASFASGAPLLAATGKLPPGTMSYSLVSMSNGKDTCVRSVEVTSDGNAQPKVISKSAGSCDVGARAPTSVLKEGPAKLPSSDMPRNTVRQDAGPSLSHST